MEYTYEMFKQDFTPIYTLDPIYNYSYKRVRRINFETIIDESHWYNKCESFDMFKYNNSNAKFKTKAEYSQGDMKTPTKKTDDYEGYYTERQKLIIIKNTKIPNFNLAIKGNGEIYDNRGYSIRIKTKRIKLGPQFEQILDKDGREFDSGAWLTYAILTKQFIRYTELENKVAKQIIAKLDSNNIPFKVIQLGGGVKKIIAKDCICPCCGGSGITKPNKIVNYPHQQHGVDYE